jgi:transposase
VNSVEQIQDPGTLRQAAILLEKENERLHARIKELIAELARLQGKEGQKQLELELGKLQEQMKLMQHRLFGPSSEKRATEKEAVDPKPPVVGHGPRVQPELPIEEVFHKLDEADQVCALCGGDLSEWEGQTEDAEEVTVVERQFVIQKHRRKKYRCQGGCSPTTAPAPPKLIPGGRYSVAFAVHIAIAKYLHHLPLERQVRMYQREGLRVESQTLWDQLFALHQHLLPSYQALPGVLFQEPLLHADETHWHLLDKGPRRKWYAWTLCSDDTVCHRILPSRSGATATELLGNYRGIVMVDGYQAYQTAANGSRGSPRFELCFCWAHVRRKLWEAHKFEPACACALELIGKLYAIEQELPDPFALEGEAQQAALVHRRAIRQELSLPIVEELKAWAYRQNALPQSTFRKAIEYMLGLWPGLVLFLDNPWVPLDNNRVERQIRDLVLGRKNHYGSKSLRGTEVAALFYSLIETARLRGADPTDYLLKAAYAAIETPGTVTLPHSAD